MGGGWFGNCGAKYNGQFRELTDLVVGAYKIKILTKFPAKPQKQNEMRNKKCCLWFHSEWWMGFENVL